MKANDRTPAFLAGGLITVLLIMVVGTLFLTGAWQLRSITGNTHTYRAFNQTLSVTPYQAWGTVPTNCALGGRQNGWASYVTTDENSSSLVHVILTTPNSYGNICAFNTGMDVTLDTVDLRNYSAGRVHRSLSMSMYNGNRASYRASINDLLTDTNTATIASFTQSYSDITWTNDGNTITLKADEYPNGRLITIGSTPIRLTMSDAIATNPAGSSTGRIELFITGIDLVPLPASVQKAPTTLPVQPSAQPVTTTPTPSPAPVTMPVPPAAPSLWESFLANVAGAWHQFLGWFGVNA